MTQETPTEHSSLVGGSTAKRRLNCPASYHLEKKAPKSKGSTYAREGTALHEMIAVILDKDKDPRDMLPFTHHQPAKGVEPAWSLTIDHDLWEELGAPALTMFDDFLDQLEAEEDAGATYYVEKRFAFPGIDDAFGTSDIVFRCGNVAGIWDWKFGRSKVDPEENEQLLFYCASARAAMPKFFGDAERLQLCISQPKLDDTAPLVWETDNARVDDFIVDLRNTVQLIRDGDENTVEIAAGSWCQFADCKTVCPLHYGAAAKIGHKIEKLEAAKHGKREPDLDMGELLADAMELAQLAESWAKHVAGITQGRLENGLDVPGWKLIPKRSPGKAWVAEDEAIKRRLARRGLKAADYQKVTLISPTQAENKLKKMGKTLPEELYEQKPSSGYTLAQEGDPRHEADVPSRKAQKLGAAMAKRLG